MTKKTLEERFWEKVIVKGEDDCWEWIGAKRRKGYGAINIDGKYPSSHRVSYEMQYGKIPENQVIDHLCRNPACVNPNHLEAVSQKENLARGIGISAINAAKTHCPKGHEYTPENTNISKKNQRSCRICQLEYLRKYNARKREALQ